jgi:D-aspartate ligase
MNVSTPVVVLPSGHHAGLGIARSLGRLGVPVYSVDEAAWEPAFSSRYCAGRFVLDGKNRSSGEYLSGLLKIGRKLGGKSGNRPILIPTTDREAVWAADNAAALGEVFRFPERDATLVRALCDKSRMQELAQRTGVATAASVVPRSKDDLSRFTETAAFPVMLKAIDTEHVRRRLGRTKMLIRTAPELLDVSMKALDGETPNFLIQEFIPGEDWMFDGYFDSNADCLFGVTAKKVRRFPPQTGVTSLGMCLWDETVYKRTTEFMKAIGYRGIVDIGYRRDSRDGQFRILDVNPRIGCTFRLFAATNGMDVVRALYLESTGQAVPSGQVAEGRKWIVEDFDLVSALRSGWTGDLGLKEWFRSLRGVQEAACFSMDDPLPALLMGVADCCEFYRWFRGRATARKRDPVERRIESRGR